MPDSSPATRPSGKPPAGKPPAGKPPAGKRPPVAEAVLATLLDEIVSGRFAPGAALPSEAALSRRFGISRTALREAMRFLAAHGLVEARTRAGTTVLPRQRWNQFDPTILEAQLRAGTDGSAIAELREALFFLMPRAAILAAERASGAQVAAIERRLHDLAEAPAGVPELQAKIDFYGAIFDAAGNWVFSQMARLLHAALSRRGERPEAADAERTSRWHKALLDAVRLQRPDDARSAMKKLVALQRAELDD